MIALLLIGLAMVALLVAVLAEAIPLLSAFGRLPPAGTQEARAGGGEPAPDPFAAPAGEEAAATAAGEVRPGSAGGQRLP